MALSRQKEFLTLQSYRDRISNPLATSWRAKCTGRDCILQHGEGWRNEAILSVTG